MPERHCQHPDQREEWLAILQNSDVEKPFEVFYSKSSSVQRDATPDLLSKKTQNQDLGKTSIFLPPPTLASDHYVHLYTHYMRLYCDLGNYTAYIDYFTFANELLSMIKSTQIIVGVNPACRWSRYLGHKPAISSFSLATLKKSLAICKLLFCFLVELSSTYIPITGLNFLFIFYGLFGDQPQSLLGPQTTACTNTCKGSEVCIGTASIYFSKLFDRNALKKKVWA